MLSLSKDVLSEITAVPVWCEQIQEENSETDLICSPFSKGFKLLSDRNKVFKVSVLCSY